MQDCSPDQGGNRAHAKTMEANASSEHISSSAQPEPNNRAQPGTSCSSDHPGTKLIDLPSGPAKSAAHPKDGMAVEALGSTGEDDRDSAGDVSEDNTDHGIKESHLDSESWMITTNSHQESATGDCLTYSDTEEAAVKPAHKKFHKKVWASCRLARQNLWKMPQISWIGKSHQTVWGSDYRVVKTEQELALNEDYWLLQDEQDDGVDQPTALH